MEKIRIDYHTGTGCSKLVAELLTEKLKMNNMDVVVHRIVRDQIIGTQKLDNINYYIMIFPVHSFNAPKPVYEWIRHLVGNGCKTAVISVSGGGNIITNSASRYKTVKLLKKSNFNVIFEEMVRMPNNWMKVPDEKKYKRILANLPQKIEIISQTILTQRKSKKIIYWSDYLVSALGELEKKGTRNFGNGIKISESCNGCGLCAQNCFSSNIQIEHQLTAGSSPKPIIGNRCDMCLACIYNCPQKALQPAWGAFQIDKKGYDLRLMWQKANIK